VLSYCSATTSPHYPFLLAGAVVTTRPMEARDRGNVSADRNYLLSLLSTPPDLPLISLSLGLSLMLLAFALSGRLRSLRASPPASAHGRARHFYRLFE